MMGVLNSATGLDSFSAEIGRQAADGLLAHGIAIVRVDARARASTDRVFGTGPAFFAQGEAEKEQASISALVEGYRRRGIEYAQSPDRPDLMESFSVWARNTSSPAVQSWASDLPLHAAMTDLLGQYLAIADATLEALRERMQPHGQRYRASDNSWLQLNYYRPSEQTRDLLQDEHEDGHLLTLATVTAPGLQVRLNGTLVPISLEHDQLAIWPGSVMTAVTGGRLQPLYHRVHNDTSVHERQSLILFVNPTLEPGQRAWIENETNAGVDIRDLLIKNSTVFGLPSLQVFEG